jgi:hypothetical protein
VRGVPRARHESVEPDMTQTRPCPSCPWWLEHEGGEAIPNFEIDLARRLAPEAGEVRLPNTTGDEA